MANSVNNYSAPAYYRKFFSSGMGKEELLTLLAEDSERLMHRGVYFTIYHDDFGIPNCNAQVMYIYTNNFTPYHDHDYYEINYVFSGELLENISTAVRLCCSAATFSSWHRTCGTCRFLIKKQSPIMCF